MRHTIFFGVLTLIAVTVCKGAVIHVPCDQPTIQAGIDAAFDGDTVLVSDGTYSGDGNRDITYLGKAIAVMSENGPDACVIDCQGTESDYHRGFSFYSDEAADSILSGFTITNGFEDPGGAIFCDESSPLIQNCIIIGNRTCWRGGGICLWTSNSVITDCIISGNTGYLDDPGASDDIYGGGVFTSGGSPTFVNCSIIGNTAEQWLYGTPLAIGGGIMTHAATLISCLIAGNYANARCGGGILTGGSILINCTIVDNDGGEDSGGICGDAETDLINCVIWNNLPDSVGGNPAITYSNVQDGYPGQGNINSDPLFAAGPLGDFYLSQVSSSQDIDSPCLDSGSDLAGNICWNDRAECLNSYTTRTDHVPDSGTVDMGFHYASSLSYPTTTPVPSPTPDPWTGVQVTLSGNRFTAGDNFKLEVSCLGNPGDPYAEMFVVLDVFGDFWFWPLWTPYLQGLLIELQPDRPVTYTILDFEWFDGDFGEVTGLKFWAAICRPRTYQVIGEIGWAEFGYY